MRFGPEWPVGDQGSVHGVSETGESLSDPSPAALYREARALYSAQRWRDAAKAFEAVVQSLDPTGGDDDVLRLGAMYMRIASLHAETDYPEVVTASDALIARFGTDADPTAVHVVADTLWLKSRGLDHSGAKEGSRRVLRTLISEYGDLPPARNAVAQAMYQEGLNLRDDGQAEDAIAMWNDLAARPRDRLDDGVEMVPVRGQLAKARLLAKTGRLDAALLTCDQMRKECAGLGLPDNEV
jgi:tetratricopeptide (TPR) repeat protein